MRVVEFSPRQACVDIELKTMATNRELAQRNPNE